MTATPNPKTRNWVMCRFCGWLMEPTRHGWICLWCSATADDAGAYGIWWRR
jgi:hypothetical protein